jgi:3-methylcrotonyl-CoA carboxylase alpha subunit
MGEITLIVGSTSVRCSVELKDDQFVVGIAGIIYPLQVTRVESGMLQLSSGGRSHWLRMARKEDKRFLHVDGYTLEYERAAAGAGTPAPPRVQEGDLTAPIPGTVTQVLAKLGDEVTRGQPLAIIEAMKMEHVVRAPRAGTVRAVRVRPGDQVEAGAVVVELARVDDAHPR